MGTGGWNGAAASCGGGNGGNVIIRPYWWCSAWGMRWTKLKIEGRHDFIQGIIQVVMLSIRINAALEDENSSAPRGH